VNPRLVELSQEHLANNGLLGKKTRIQKPINFDLPKLQGSSLDEHFFKLGAEISQPYLQNGMDFIAKGVPRRPDPSTWVLQSGWTKYVEGKEPEKIDMPDQDCLIFDVETLYKLSDFAVMAVAASSEAWYGWVSPWVTGESESDRHLVPLVSKDRKALIVGHNIGYDRKRVKEEYNIHQSSSFYLDTMSLHVAVNGMCSQQRPAWMRINKNKMDDDEMTLIDPAAEGVSEFMQDLQENPWFKRSSLNNLADCAKFHCNIEVDKSRRDYFKELDCAGVREKFNDLMDYCSSDVNITFEIYTIVLPGFLEVCPHPVSFAALRHLSSVFLPINENWQKFVETSEKCYRTTEAEIYQRLKSLADTYVKYKNSPDMYENDPWLSQLDWTIAPVRYVQGKKGEPNRLAGRQKHPGMPNWYRDLFKSGTSPMNLSVRSRITPRLLRLQWDGHPLIWSDTFGYVFKVDRVDSQQYEESNYAKCDMNLEKNPTFRDDVNVVYFKIPHKDGHDARCTNPLAKPYITYFEKGTLSSEYEYAEDVIKMNAECTYWIAARERIFNQMPVYQEDVDMGIKGKAKNNFGMIIPKLIPMGTITRRSVEDSWLTASNAKKNRIGSELKAMIQAPPGYKFVGADVDSEELWIASLIGDSLFGIHGGTALGWMTLEGTKSEGTDLHSKTASILGISRNEAKIFNYGRIYGAGLKFAIQLLKQFNPLIPDEQAKATASRLYEATKGIKTKSKAFESIGTFWRGGSESVVFNRLEALAEQDIPRTPVLGAAITQALMKSNLRKTNFLTSRVNWSIQSSGVDYLHLLIVSMDYLIRTYGIRARLSLTVHDEIRYLVKEEDVYKASLALQISNLWTRAMFCHQLGIENVPQSCAFFSLIDIDHVLRKEVDLDCVTPSNPTPIPPGEAIDIESLLEICPKLLRRSGRTEKIDYEPYKYVPSDHPSVPALNSDANAPYLRAQIVTDLGALKDIETRINPRLRRRVPPLDGFEKPFGNMMHSSVAGKRIPPAGKDSSQEPFRLSTKSDSKWTGRVPNSFQSPRQPMRL
jgi:DNA polymerase gamma 1